MARPSTITNQQILQAARQVFLSEGFAASTGDIAKRARVSEGTIFKRFATKEDLFLAAMGTAAAPALMSSLPGRVGKGDLRQGLVSLALELIELYREVLPRVTMMWSCRLPPSQLMKGMTDPPPVRGLRALTAFFDGEQRLGRIGGCDPEVVARLFAGAIHHYVNLEMMGMARRLPMAAPSFARGLVDVLWNGIASDE